MTKTFVQLDSKGEVVLDTIKFTALSLEVSSWLPFTRTGRLANELKQLDIGEQYQMQTAGQTIIRRIK